MAYGKCTMGMRIGAFCFLVIRRLIMAIGMGMPDGSL